MKLKNSIYGLLAVGLLGAALTNTVALSKEEDKDKLKPTPEAEAKITQAIKAAYADAIIGTMGKETEDGISFYEVAFTSKETKIEADVTSDGTILGSEEAADPKTFPSAAAAAIKKAAKGMKIKSGEISKTFAKGVKDDTTGDTQVIHVVKLGQPSIAYEVDVEKGDKKGEISVSADGTILEMPKWAKSGKKDDEDEKDDKD